MTNKSLNSYFPTTIGTSKITWEYEKPNSNSGLGPITPGEPALVQWRKHSVRNQKRSGFKSNTY